MSVREAAKLLAGSTLVYAVATGLPSYERRPDSHEVAQSTGAVLVPGAALAADGSHSGGARLAPTYLESDDGSRQFLGWHDRLHDVDCSFAVAADGVWRCIPNGADAGHFFADAACTQGLATLPRGCASSPAFAVVHDVPACGWPQTRQVFSLGARFTGPLVYWVADGACAAVSSNSLVLYDLYAVGDEVQASSFVGATPVVER